MKQLILSGVLLVASGLFGLMAQPQGQPAKPPAQGGQAAPPAQGAPPAQQQGPAPKSQAEAQAFMALQQAQGNPDATIKAAEELMTKFADTQFKEIALYMEAISYEQKGDFDKAIIYGRRVLDINPKNFQVTLLLGEVLAQRTRENDLDKEEKLTEAAKLLNGTIENIKSAAKPNPQVTDQQWEEAKKFVSAEAHNGLGLIALTRKKYDVAIAEFETAVKDDPQPAYSVRLASAQQSSGKNAEAIALCDKILADPQLHPQIKAVAENIKKVATAASQKK